MTRANTRPTHFGARLLHGLARFGRNSEGNVGPLMALMIVPIVASFGLVIETSNWYLNQRALQNAADSAAIAASTSNGTATASSCLSTPGTFDCEAKGALGRYNIVSGANTVTQAATGTSKSSSTIWTNSSVSVIVTYATSGCPGTVTNCYTVAIAKPLPLSLTEILGYRGNGTLNGAPAQRILATAVASAKGPPTDYCLTALGNSGTAIQFQGASKLDLTGCDIASNGGASCNGQSGTTLRYADVFTLGNNKICGTQRQATTTFSDAALKAMKANIPAKTCGSSYPQANGQNNLTTAQQLTNYIPKQTWTSPKQFCGDIKLTGDVTVSSDMTLMLYNGRLDLAGHTLSVLAGSGAHLTIILSGDDTATNTYRHTIISSSNGGMLDYTAPLGGTWSGVAIYQNPDLAAGSGLNLAYTGSNPDLALTGLIYVPKGNIDLSGAIGHSTEGFSCLSLVAKTISINGTASLFAYPTIACNRFSSFPVVGVPGTQTRLALVQ